MKTIVCFALLVILNTSSAFAEPTKSENLAKGQGIKTCLPKIRYISSFLMNDADHAVLMTGAKKDPDQKLSIAHLVRPYPDGSTVSVMNTAPGPSGQCSGAYTTIIPMDKPCAVVRETTLKDFTFVESMAGLLRFTDKAGSVDAILLPVAQGCAVVKSEAVF